MENVNKTPNNIQSSGGGKVMAGLLLIVVGFVILASKLDLYFFPSWLFSWPMLLIVIGLFIGFRHNFRKPAWLIMVLIGSLFLINDLVTGFNLRVYFWPVLLIAIGLWVMLKPRNRYDDRFTASPNYSNTGTTDPGYSYRAADTGTDTNAGNFYSSEEIVSATAILGGIKKNIISKNFLGGEVVSVFGGTELNLSQADIQHPVILEATQIFGGTTLIIPPHWQVKSEMVAILGGIDDKRPVMPGGYDPNKVLILKGTTLFGGLNIKSY